MKTLHKFLLVSTLVAGALAFASGVEAQRLSIDVGDRPYYTHGASYWDNGVEYYWVPGHRGSHHRWVRGHYIARGHRGAHIGVGGIGIHIH